MHNNRDRRWEGNLQVPLAHNCGGDEQETPWLSRQEPLGQCRQPLSGPESHQMGTDPSQAAVRLWYAIFRLEMAGLGTGKENSIRIVTGTVPYRYSRYF